MLAPHLVEEVRRLLASGTLSQRTIARRTGVSRGTVGLIAAGRRRDPVRIVQPWDEEPGQPLEPPRRCPTCGGLVYMPCRLCHIRQLMEKQKQAEEMHPSHPGGRTFVSGIFASGGRTFVSGLRKTDKNVCPPRRMGNHCSSGLMLKPDHRRRYEEVRHRREELGIIE
jgi:hypothetical protein